MRRSSKINSAQSDNISNGDYHDVVFSGPGLVTPASTPGSTPSPGSGSRLATLYTQSDGAPALWSGGEPGVGDVTPGVDFGNRLVQVKLPTQAFGSRSPSVYGTSAQLFDTANQAASWDHVATRVSPAWDAAIRD